MKILVVEDEKKIATFLKEVLEAESFTVDVAHDGETGLYLAQLNSYVLVILDNMLPKKEGVDIVRELREKGRTTPVLILSVKSEASKKVDLLDAGADDYLTKPFVLSELLARIKALLRRPGTIQKEVLVVGDLVLDTKRGIVARKDREIYLTRKEYMLLRYLMQHEGSILSRGMIMEHVWDMDVDPFSNTIESHIASLRRKIDRESSRKLIHTIPGRGYRIGSLTRALSR